MPPESRDPAYLWDMLAAARAIRQFTEGVSFEEYGRNLLLQSAVERQLEILGEAARRTSPNFKNVHPEIPWRQIVGLRNVLAHEYGDIQHHRLWQVATQSIPSLISVLVNLLPPQPPEAL
jgi:uncharacterized protein with HEPN domain